MSINKVVTITFHQKHKVDHYFIFNWNCFDLNPIVKVTSTLFEFILPGVTILNRMRVWFQKHYKQLV